MSEKRLNKIKNFLKQSPNDSFLIYALAKEHEKLGDLSTAISTYESLVESDPDYVGTYYHLGKAYELQNDFPKALEIYEKGMAIAKEIGDKHALSELAGAKMLIEE